MISPTTEIVRDLMDCEAVQRLDGLSFLGAIDSFGLPNSHTSGTRLDHTIGVAQITEFICRSKNYSVFQKNFCMAVAMLHDIGHTVFSHSGERYMIKRFKLNHNDIRNRILKDDRDISFVLEKYGIIKKDIFDTINKSCLSKNDFATALFDSPINPDTVDGILRSSRFFGIDIRWQDQSRLIDFWRITDGRGNRSANVRTKTQNCDRICGNDAN